MRVTHEFVSGQPDDPASPEKVQASHWNGDHVIEDANAVDIAYDNAGSGLAATTVQAALDELAAGGGGGGGSYVGCRAYNDGQQAIPGSTVTVVNFDSESWDTAGIHSTSLNPSRFTIPADKGGRWRFNWRMHVTSSGGTLVGYMRKNGGDDTSALIGSGGKVTGSSLASITLSGAVTENLAVGDYVELFCYFQGGGSIGQSVTEERAFITTMEAQFLG